MLTHPAIVRQRSAPKGRGYTSAAGILAWTLDAFDFFALVFMVENLATHF